MSLVLQGKHSAAEEVLVSSRLIWAAVDLNVRLFNWDRALGIAEQSGDPMHVQGVLWLRCDHECCPRVLSTPVITTVSLIVREFRISGSNFQRPDGTGDVTITGPDPGLLCLPGNMCSCCGTRVARRLQADCLPSTRALEIQGTSVLLPLCCCTCVKLYRSCMAVVWQGLASTVSRYTQQVS